MKRKKIIRFFYALLALTLTILVIDWQITARYSNYVNGGLTNEKLRYLLASEIQPGISRLRVEAWLNTRKIKHNYHDKTSFYDRLSIHKYEARRVVIAHVDNTIPGFLVHGSTLLTFFFDSKGKLLRYKAEDLLTGL